jgi:hypothetical protein
MKTTTIVRSVLLTAICLLASKLPSSAQNLFSLSVPNYSFQSLTHPGANAYTNQEPESYNFFPTTEVFTGWENGNNPGGGYQVQGVSTVGGANYGDITATGTFQGTQAALVYPGSYAGPTGAVPFLSLNPVTTVANGGTGGVGTIAKNATYTLTLAIYAPAGANASSFQLLATTQAADTNSYQYGSGAPGDPVTTGPSPFPVITTAGVLASSGSINGGTTGSGFTDYTISFDTLHGHNAALLGDGLTIGFNLGAGAYADNVRLTELAVVPEPSTWALMLAGLAGLFIVGRRKLKA